MADDKKFTEDAYEQTELHVSFYPLFYYIYYTLLFSLYQRENLLIQSMISRFPRDKYIGIMHHAFYLFV